MNHHHHDKQQQQTYQESTISRNYRKQPYWALHTYFGKYKRKSTIDSTLKLALYAQ
jgi:3'-phosphoadenosine 5'-phosphosulfate (PAPS) 3'-phosphatase